MNGRWRLVATCALLAVAACNRHAPASEPTDEIASDEPAEAIPSPTPSPAPSPTPSLVVPVAPATTSDRDDAESPDSGDAALPAPVIAPPTPGASPSSAPQPAGPATPAPVAEQRFAPRNDCAALPGWPAFHDKLAKAVAGKDAAALSALAAPSIKLDYGGGAGREELRKRLADTKRGAWRELARILPLGCAVADGIVAMPWYFWNLPPDADAYGTMLVTGEGVPLRAKPDPDARALATLDWAMVSVRQAKADPAGRYTAVRTRAGKADGFILTDKLRSVLAWRLIAERQGGEWKLTAFIAGD